MLRFKEVWNVAERSRRKMACDKNTVIRSLQKVFKIVMLDSTLENVPEAAIKCSASSRNETQEKNNLSRSTINEPQNVIYNWRKKKIYKNRKKIKATKKLKKYQKVQKDN